MDIKTSSLIQFYLGLILVLAGALLMVLTLLPLSFRITIGIVGILLIVTSKFRLVR